MEQTKVEYDCVRCGACCYNPDDNRALDFIDYVEIDPRDRLMRRPELVRRLVVLDDDLIPHMRLNHLHRCAALTGRLGVKVGCGIYRDRPSMCRTFRAGSKKCQELRRERGLQPASRSSGRAAQATRARRARRPSGRGCAPP